jgi:hypothetical protein
MGIAGGSVASEDLAAPGFYVEPWLCRTGVDLEGRQIVGMDWMRKLFGKGAAAAVCCEGEEGAFSAKL